MLPSCVPLQNRHYCSLQRNVTTKRVSILLCRTATVSAQPSDAICDACNNQVFADSNQFADNEQLQAPIAANSRAA